MIKKILIAVAACVLFACALPAQTTHTANRFQVLPSPPATCTVGSVYYDSTQNVPYWCGPTANTWTSFAAGSGSGTVTGATFTGGIISVTGTVTLAFTVAGTSGGVPYFSSTSAWASSGLLPTGDFVLGGGAGGAPTATFSVVPVANGGTGTGSTLTGLVRGSASAMTAAELSGDATTSGSNAVTVKAINGTALSGLATGILYNTTTTGVPSIATAAQILAACTGCAPLASPTFTGAPNIAAATGTSLAVTGNLSSGSSPPTCTAGTGGVFCATEGTTSTGASSIDEIWADSSLHCQHANWNNVDKGCLQTTLTIGTATNCSSSASPAVCGSAAAGSVVIPTGTVSETLTVNTTAVTANSQIFFYPDDTLGTKLSVTCNSTLATLIGGSAITARTAGTSFQITFNGTIATNGVCGSFVIVN